MKKQLILLSFAVLCCGLPLFGQLQPKTLFATGDWSFFSDLDNQSIQDYNARAGILIDENLTLGGFLNRQHFERFSNTGPDITHQLYGLFSRYFFKSNGQAVPFLEGEAFFGSRNFNFEDNDLDFNNTLWGFYLGGGLDWLLSSSAAIEGRAGVQLLDEEGLDARANVLADLGLAFFLPAGGGSIGSANPPLAQGLLMIGGKASFQWDISGNDTGADPMIAIHPLFGYQFHPRWMAGGAFSFTSGQQEGATGAVLNEADLTVGLYPFIRLYINPDDKFKAFAEGMAGAAFERNSFNNEYPFRLRGSAGADFFLSPEMALEGLIGYQGAKNLDANTGWEDGLVISVGLRAFAGR